MKMHIYIYICNIQKFIKKKKKANDKEILRLDL